MAQFGAKTAVPLLVRALDDKDDEVFLQVIRALARIGDPAAAAPLRALLQNGRRLAGGTHVRFWAGYALMGLKDPQGFPTVAEYLGREQEPMQRRAAVDALRELGDKSAVGLLAGLIHDNDPDVRADAIVALGHVGDATSLPALRELLNDPDQRVGRFISARRPFLRMTTVTPGEAAQRAIREIERRGGVPGR
jgi:HEAT repeat protein